MRYRVAVHEVHIQSVLVNADSPEDAIQAIHNGEGDYEENSLEYSHSIDPEKWEVFEAGDED